MLANLLTLKNLTKIHFVDKGAAIGARVLVVKRAGARAEETHMTFEEQLAAQIAKNLTASFAKEGMGDQSPQQLLEQSLAKVPEETRAAILAAVAAMFQSQPPAPAAPAPAPADKADDAAPPADEPKPAAPVPAAKVDDEPPKEEGMAKAYKEKLDAEISKRKALEEEVATLSEHVAKGQADAELATEMKVAESYPNVKGDFKKRAAKLLVLKKTSQEMYDEEITNLAATEEMAKKSIKKAKGTSRFDGDDGKDEDGSATVQLEKMADALVKEAVEKGKEKLTFDVAWDRVTTANKDLYMRSVKERRGNMQQMH